MARARGLSRDSRAILLAQNNKGTMARQGSISETKAVCHILQSLDMSFLFRYATKQEIEDAILDRGMLFSNNFCTENSRFLRPLKIL